VDKAEWDRKSITAAFGTSGVGVGDLVESEDEQEAQEEK
jgi:hypothetical protein